MVLKPVIYHLEACVDSFDQALKAQKGGANQVELCSRLDLDGLTPSIEGITQCLSDLKIFTKVMIRPAAGDFITTDQVVVKMISEIKAVKKLGVQHVVFGLTKKEGRLDIETLSKLRDHAYPMNVTIHKAIDTCSDLITETRRLTDAGGFDSILTSGGAKTAMEGAKIIKEMIDVAGDQLNIIAAGSITKSNIDEVDAAIGGQFYHGRRIVGELHSHD